MISAVAEINHSTLT
uniref:Uncharacterized protein n=1 Tax=Anguilla anguilla TaxID=7936 RepID=A0A0E9R148_ANGAN